MLEDKNTVRQEENAIKLNQIVYNKDIINLENHSSKLENNLNFNFELLKKEENYFNDAILSKIRKYAKDKILISAEQFEFLIELAISAKKYKDARKILRIIKSYSFIENNEWFLSVAPPDFLEKMSKFIPHSIAFTIYRYRTLNDPENTPMILTEMNIIEAILDNLDNDESILLYSELLKNENTNSIYAEYFFDIVSEVIKNFNDSNDDYDDYYDYYDYYDDSTIQALCSLIDSKDCNQLIIQDSDALAEFLDKLSTLLPHNCIFKIYRKFVSLDPENTPSILTEMNIIEAILANLDKYESILLYSELLRNENTSMIYSKYYPNIISEVIIKCKDNDDYIYDLSILINNNECVQIIIQDPNFFSIFDSEKYQSNYFRDKLMKLINLLCQYDKSTALTLTTTPIWEFALESFDKVNKLKKSELRRKKKFYEKFFLFLYNIGMTHEGRRFLFENDIHTNLFEIVKDGQYVAIHNSIEVLCQIGLTDDINIIAQLVENGLIDILADSILCLNLQGKKIAVECLLHIQMIGETNDVDELSDAIFDNVDIMEALGKMSNSYDNDLRYNSYTLELRGLDWGRDE